MKASLRSVRIAPKKAQLVAKLIRGKPVPDAMYTLERTNKKAARLFEELLKSAIANASHNEKQDPQMMIIKSLTVNKAQAYHRGVPMARGRVRPMRKFLSHIDMSLGFADDKQEEKGKRKEESGKKQKTEKDASKTEKKPVQKEAITKKSTKSTTGKSSTKKETTSKTSKSSTSEKSSK